MNSALTPNFDLDSIYFIFAKYYSKGYYAYTVNSMDNFRLIPKENLAKLILQFKYEDCDKLNFLLDRYLPFLFDTKNCILKEFNITNPCPSKEELYQKSLKELNPTVSHKSLKDTHTALFGKLNKGIF